MVLDIFVREWAIVTLGRYFSFRVQVLEGHKVVDTGPYHLVRHPSCAGAILTVVGIGVALRSWAAALLLFVFCEVTYGYRMTVEERVLLKELGEDYAKYKERTKRLIPFVF